MTQPNLVGLAKQGNIEAITALLNDSLQSKNITAKSSLKDGCLQIILEADRVPNQQSITKFLIEFMTELGVGSIKQVKIYGRQRDNDFLDLIQEFELGSQPLSQSNLNSFSLNSYVQTNEKASTLPVSNSINANQEIKPRQNITPQYASTLNNLDMLDIILLMFLGVAFISYVSSLELNIIILAILALIPAQIASNKGRKFIRWYCYGCYSFIIAFIFILLLSEDKASSKNKKSDLEKRQIEIEDREKAYFLLLESVSLPVEKIEKKLLQIVLAFRKLQARVAVGISYNDFPAVLAPAKLVVQEFERSKDYNISSILSDLITKIMFMYEFSQECMKRKAYCTHLFTYPSCGGIGIPTTNEFGKVIEKEFPNLPKKYVSLGVYCYEFDTATQYIWAKAAEYTNILEKILKGSQP
jgi:hypothetical protein